MSWSLQRFVVGPIECNCYILSDTVSREACVIDPGAESREILQYLERNRLEVQRILLTHGHIDHIGGVEMFRDMASQVYFHPGDEPLYRDVAHQAALFGARPADLQAVQPTRGPLPLSDGQVLSSENGSVRVIHTPGHTPGSVCFLTEGEQQWLFCGDTLFQGSIGRTDLWGGSYERILESIRGRLMVLDDSVRILPGHGEATTIGIERDSNPFILGY